jgi:hypothetical protein
MLGWGSLRTATMQPQEPPLKRQVNIWLPVELVQWLDSQPEARQRRLPCSPGHRAIVIQRELEAARAREQGEQAAT